MFRNWINETSREKWESDFFDNSVMSVRQWVATLAVIMIPVVNIVMIFWWAFANKELTPANKVNWARASIIIITVLIIAVAIVAGFLYLGWKMHSAS